MTSATQQLINALALLPHSEEQRLASEWLDELQWQQTQQDSGNFLLELVREIETEIASGRVVDLEEIIRVNP